MFLIFASSIRNACKGSYSYAVLSGLGHAQMQFYTANCIVGSSLRLFICSRRRLYPITTYLLSGFERGKYSAMICASGQTDLTHVHYFIFAKECLCQYGDWDKTTFSRLQCSKSKKMGPITYRATRCNVNPRGNLAIYSSQSRICKRTTR